MIRVRRLRFDAKNSIAIMKEVRQMSKKSNIWKILGMTGMIFGFLGTMMQGYAEDKELDAKINEAVDKKLAESNRTEGQ